MKKLIFFIFFGALFLGVNAQLNPTTTWQLTGNSVSDGNFLGATNCKPLIFKTRNAERMWLSAGESSLGIGTQYPKATLHLHYQKDSSPCDGNNRDGDDEDSTNTRGFTRNLLWLTTPETGNYLNNGFFISYNDLNLTFSQLEQGKFFLKGPGGGLTITPDGKIGMGTDVPLYKLDVNGSFKAQSADITGTVSAANANVTTRVSAKELRITSDAGIGEYVAWININKNQTKAFAITTRRTAGIDEEVFVVYGNGTVNAKKIYAEEINVTLNAIGSYPDYVFAKDYNLRPLSELEQFIKENHHLPEIPTEAEVQENGIDLGSMQTKLLLKVEELTLYILDLQKQIDELKQMKGGE